MIRGVAIGKGSGGQAVLINKNKWKLPKDHCPDCKLKLPGPESVYLHFVLKHIAEEKKKYPADWPWRNRDDATKRRKDTHAREVGRKNGELRCLDR